MIEGKKILYVGGFELPDKNAAAQRVIANSKALKELGHKVTLVGVAKDLPSGTFIDDTVNNTGEFEYYSIKYPSSIIEWIKYLKNCIPLKFIENFKPDIIIAYNYPALALNNLNIFCKKKNIKLIADVTEWYTPGGNNPVHRILKWVDTTYRMKVVHKKIDGIIAISRFLYNYYSNINRILVPPLVDISNPKWNRPRQITANENLTLVYAGSPGSGGKDRLDLIISGVIKIKEKIILKLVGLTKEQYEDSFGLIPDNKQNIIFLGRVPHTQAIKEIQDSDFQIFLREKNITTNAGFPTKFVESLANGTPVLTNLSSNIGDYLIDGKNGYIVKSLNDKDIYHTIKTASSLTKETIIKMKQNCIDDTQFDYKSYVSKFKIFLDSL